MSHIVTLNVEIKDLDAFAEACKVLGGQYLSTESQWRWFGRFLADYDREDAAYKHGIEPKRYGISDAGIARFSGCGWDVGIYKHPTKPGVMIPVMDFYAGGHGLVERLGRNLELLKEEYGAQVAMQVAARKGWKVQRTKHPQTGRMRLVCHR